MSNDIIILYTNKAENGNHLNCSHFCNCCKTKGEFKELAKKVQRISKNLGYDIKLGHALELVSQVEFNQNWHLTSIQLDHGIIRKKDANEIVFNKALNQEYILSIIKNMLEEGELRNKFNLGLSLDRNKFLLKDFEKEPNALFVGAMGSGKTSSARFTLTNWMIANGDQTMLFIVDPLKGAGTYNMFFDLPQCNIVTSHEKIIRMIDLLWEEAMLRKDLFKEHNVNGISAYENQTGKIISKCVILMEQFHAIPYNIMDFDRNYRKEGTTAYKYHQLMRIGRVLGIWFLACSQKSTSSDVPREIVPNFTQKQIFKVSRAESNYVLGNSDPASLTSEQKGTCYTDYGKIDFPYFDEKITQELLNKYVKELKSKCIRITPKLIKDYLESNSPKSFYRHRTLESLTKNFNQLDSNVIISLLHEAMGHKVIELDMSLNYISHEVIMKDGKKKGVVITKNVKSKHLDRLIEAISEGSVNGGIIYSGSNHISASLYRHAYENNIEIIDHEDLILLGKNIDNSIKKGKTYIK